MAEPPRTRIVGSPSKIENWHGVDQDGKPMAVTHFFIPGYEIEIHMTADSLQGLCDSLGKVLTTLRAKVN